MSETLRKLPHKSLLKLLHKLLDRREREKERERERKRERERERDRCGGGCARLLSRLHISAPAGAVLARLACWKGRWVSRRGSGVKSQGFSRAGVSWGVCMHFYGLSGKTLARAKPRRIRRRVIKSKNVVTKG